MAQPEEKPRSDDEAREGGRCESSAIGSPVESLLFRPSSLTNAASRLATFSGSWKRPASPELQSERKLLKLATEDQRRPSLTFDTPRIMSSQSPTSRGFNGASTPSLLSKRSSEASSDTPIPKKNNLFMQCMEGAESSTSTPDTEEENTKFVFGQGIRNRVLSPKPQTSDSTVVTPDAKVSPGLPDKSGSKTADALVPGSPLAFSSNTSIAKLPEVELVTGEEGERHITHIACKLFMFESSVRQWKEKGSGELRLNDSPQSEGVYQSRIVMRAGGNLRVLLNTHLWSQMKWEQAGQRSIRLTAQEEGGRFGIYLIKGVSKDIGQLYTAVDRRLQALKRSADKTKDVCSPSKVSNLPDEDESILGDKSSPESSPENLRQPSRLEKPSNEPVVSPPITATSASSTPGHSSPTKPRPPFSSLNEPASFASVANDTPTVNDLVGPTPQTSDISSPQS